MSIEQATQKLIAAKARLDAARAEFDQAVSGTDRLAIADATSRLDVAQVLEKQAEEELVAAALAEG